MIGERWFSSWCFCRHYKYWTYCQQHRRRTSTDPIFQCALWWFVWVCAGRRERASPSHPSKSWIMPPYFGLFGRRSSEMLICEARYYSYRRALVVANVYVRQSSSNLRLMCLENPLFWTKNWWETFRVDFFRPFFAGHHLSPKWTHKSPQMGIFRLIKNPKSEQRDLQLTQIISPLDASE